MVLKNENDSPYRRYGKSKPRPLSEIRTFFNTTVKQNNCMINPEYLKKGTPTT